jgi:hypothetical protein
MILDSFSLSNYESLGKKAFTIPKLMAVMKCVVKDLPQFIIELFYIFMFSVERNDTHKVIFYTIVGALTFLISVFEAVHAHTSHVDIKRVLTLIEQRTLCFHD